MDQRHITDRQQTLTDLARQDSAQRKETTTIVGVGATVSGWPVKIKTHVAYNVYTVCAVVIGATGTVPVEMGLSVEATNLAESFLAEGTLSVGTYAVMFRSGQKNVFYAEP